MSTMPPSPPARPVDSPERRGTMRDVGRLVAIADLLFDDPDVARRLRALADEAGARLGMPVSLVTLVLDEAQVFAAHHGLDGTPLAAAGGTPLEWSFCVNVVERDAPFVVEDARRDAVLAANPLVADGTIGSYLGVPLAAPDGTPVGAVCTIDAGTRTFSDADVAALQDIADEVRRLLGGGAVTTPGP